MIGVIDNRGYDLGVALISSSVFLFKQKMEYDVVFGVVVFVFFFKQKTAYELRLSLVGSPGLFWEGSWALVGSPWAPLSFPGVS